MHDRSWIDIIISALSLQTYREAMMDIAMVSSLSITDQALLLVLLHNHVTHHAEATPMNGWSFSCIGVKRIFLKSSTWWKYCPFWGCDHTSKAYPFTVLCKMKAWFYIAISSHPVCTNLRPKHCCRTGVWTCVCHSTLGLQAVHAS